MSSDMDQRISGLGERPQRKARFPHPAIILGYSVGVLMFVVGVLILGGWMFHEGVPDQFRIMFGIVITLMAVYRFVLTRSRSIQKRREEREEE